MSTFYDRFLARRGALRSVLCVGIDPDPAAIPNSDSGIEGTFSFLREIIQATAPYACAYKPNVAFFEVLGPAGWDLFGRIVQCIRREAPEALIVADAKRGDLANTARFYAETFFKTYNCDGLTVNPYMGMESLAPYDQFSDRGVFALCLTSNPGAVDFQMQGSPPLFEQVARSVQERNAITRNYWMVAGATRDADSLSRIKSIAPSVPLLIPGVGAQGGELGVVLRNCGADVLVNASRSILYAYKEHSGVSRGEAAARSAKNVVDEMRSLLSF